MVNRLFGYLLSDSLYRLLSVSDVLFISDFTFLPQSDALSLSKCFTEFFTERCIEPAEMLHSFLSYIFNYLRSRFLRQRDVTSFHLLLVTIPHFPQKIRTFNFQLSTFNFQLIINPPSCVFVQFILSFHITYHIMQYTIDKYVTLRC